MTKRITETDLILPTLYILEFTKIGVTTAFLIKKLREIMNPIGEDLLILSGRKDDKFSQKVRNLNAHKTLEKLGYAKYKGTSRSGHFEITIKGKNHLIKNQEILNYFFNNDFNYSDLIENLRKIEKNKKKKIEIFDENIIIHEGFKRYSEVSVYERSTKLREYAINYFTKNNRISCNCCNFNFSDFYGKNIGDSFIEIHHIKPIFKFKQDDLSKTLKQAIKNLIPVCSNCHRMIHRNIKNPIEIKFLTSQISQNGIHKR